MSVWLVLPSARPAEEAEACLKFWRDKGYHIAVFREGARGPVAADILVNTLPYPGYARACNALCSLVLAEDPIADWMVVAADDIHPDTHVPERIAMECSDHFRNHHIEETGETIDVHPTFGVMQPVGDRWGARNVAECHDFETRPEMSGVWSGRCQSCGRPEDNEIHQGGAYIDRIAGSPWIGREFAQRMYGGKGPYWPEYTHFGVDEELRAVALMHGVYWPRPDLTHFHNHWGRPRVGEKVGRADRMPEFLKRANSPEEWQRYKRIFAERKAAGFPGSDPL